MQLKGRKRPFIEAPQIVEFDALRVDPRGENETFGVEGRHGPAGQLHQALAVGRSEVPETNRFVEGAGQKGVVGGGHAERNHSFGVTSDN